MCIICCNAERKGYALITSSPNQLPAPATSKLPSTLACCVCLDQIKLCTKSILWSCAAALSGIPKFFLSGFAWQGAASAATEILGGAYPNLTMGYQALFAIMTGLGGGLGVFAGNMVSHITTYFYYVFWKEKALEPTYWKTAGRESALYALAAIVADSIWQPLVTALGTCTLSAIYGTGALCAVAFLITLVVAKRFILKELWYGDLTAPVSELRPKFETGLLVKDTITSLWNVFLAASVFVFTNCAMMKPLDLQSPFFIEQTTSTIEGMWRAGQATLTGYSLSQVMEILVKKMLVCCGVIKPKDYGASMV